MIKNPINKAVFLDRDGVIVIPHFREGRSFAVRSMADFHLYPDAYESLVRLKENGFLLIVVTNQPDVGRGLISSETLEKMNLFLFQNLPIDDIRVCPHTKEEGCGCKKPKPGLLQSASKDFNIDCTASYMVGDRQSDVEVGRAVGCKTVFIDLGYTAETKPENADFFSRNLKEAAHWIVKSS